MQPITEVLTKQATRTVASRAIRTQAKQHMSTSSLFYKVGVAALIAGVGHFITKSGKSQVEKEPFESKQDILADLLDYTVPPDGMHQEYLTELGAYDERKLAKASKRKLLELRRDILEEDAL